MLLLCGADRSDAGDHAARVAALLARRLGAELRFATSDAIDAPARLAAEARATGCDLLVVGAAPGGRFTTALRGDALTRLERRTPCPVMVVPPGAALPTGDSVVLGYGVSDPARAAAAAGRLAGGLGAELVLTHVIADPDPGRGPTGWQVYDAARRARRAAVRAAGDRRLRVEVAERQGSPPEELALAPAERSAAFVVVGARRHRGPFRAPRRASLGAQLARRAEHPVVLVPSAAP